MLKNYIHSVFEAADNGFMLVWLADVAASQLKWLKLGKYQFLNLLLLLITVREI